MSGSRVDLPDPGGAVTTSRGSFRNESLTACAIAPTGKCNGILCIVILRYDKLMSSWRSFSGFSGDIRSFSRWFDGAKLI